MAPRGRSLLHGVAQIDQHLTKAMQPFPGFSGIFGNGAMPRHDDVGREGFDRIQCFQPAHAVAVVDVEKLVGENSSLT
mgnify:CR=1 FL=1